MPEIMVTIGIVLGMEHEGITENECLGASILKIDSGRLAFRRYLSLNYPRICHLSWDGETGHATSISQTSYIEPPDFQTAIHT